MSNVKRHQAPVGDEVHIGDDRKFMNLVSDKCLMPKKCKTMSKRLASRIVVVDVIVLANWCKWTGFK